MSAADFGAQIAARRVELGLSQSEVARYLQVTVRAVQKWEAGDAYPSFEIGCNLLAWFDIRPSEVR